jgi:putrescine transport system permease protein
MNALATIFITTVTIGVIAVNRWMQLRERKRNRDMQLAIALAEAADPLPLAPQQAAVRKSLDTVRA